MSFVIWTVQFNPIYFWALFTRRMNLQGQAFFCNEHVWYIDLDLSCFIWNFFFISDFWFLLFWSVWNLDWYWKVLIGCFKYSAKKFWFIIATTKNHTSVSIAFVEKKNLKCFYIKNWKIHLPIDWSISILYWCTVNSAPFNLIFSCNVLKYPFKMLFSWHNSYDWHHVVFFYDRDGHYNVGGQHTCHLLMQTIAEMYRRQDITYSSFATDTAVGTNMTENLKREVGLDHTSK